MAGLTCFICCNSVTEEEDGITVKERGVKTLIESSKRRKDGKHSLLLGKTSVFVHNKCRKIYTKEQNIEKVARGATTRVTRSVVEGFDFKKNCLFCGKDATEAFKKNETKKPISKRDTVHEIQTLGFTDSVNVAAIDRDDAWGEEVLRRISTVSDLVAAEGRYHGTCFKKFLKQASAASDSAGRRESKEISDCIKFICDYMEENEDLCQFALDDILKTYSGYVPKTETIMKKLIERYNGDVIVVSGSNQFKQTTICFRNTGHTILTNSWYESKNNDMHDERLRVVKAAAQIIREDIRSQVYSLNKYPSPDQFLATVGDDIPASLKLLLDTVTTQRKNQGNEIKHENKVKSIAHAIISTTRPRSFTSPILLGIGTFLYRKYGSRNLVDVLSALGFSSSYNDVRNFEVSCLQQPLKIVTNNSFTQFVFDNADINMDTIDGHDTFHAMGGIQCFTPNTSFSPRAPIDKFRSIPSAVSLREYGTTSLDVFQKQNEGGLASLTVQNITNSEREVLPMSTDLLWLYGKWKELHFIPGWNGFMERVTENKSFVSSSILCLPFIKAPPTNYDTVYTALKTAAQKCEGQHQKICFVTFDQPLYIKAREIVASCGSDSDLSSVIVRLGGFHLLMSFMGAVGYIMDGSGLQHLFNVSYALASINTMMSGHFYSRAVRGHFLAHLALAKKILSTMHLTDEENSAILAILDNFGTDNFQIEETCMDSILLKLKEKLHELEENGPTAKLWVQYFRMVSILKHFVEAEKSGNWQLHLQSINDMLPYFHASGHFNYAKVCHLYLQDMMQLESRLSPTEYDKFVTKGFFTIRRSHKFWSGIWSDMTIEQVLMRSMKAEGGLSRGRGISDGTLARWIAAMPIAVDISHQIEEFCGVSFTSTDQHVDSTNSRRMRDNIDVQKFGEWFDSHDPFPVGDTIMCISTGVIGYENINCHEAYEIGKSIMENIIGSSFKELKFQRKNRVMPLRGVNCAVKINDEQVPVNSDTIFRRIPFHMKSQEQLKSYFAFELAPYPLSLFDDCGMRKTRKSDLYNFFTPVNTDERNAAYVIDGGFLLHRVVWQTREQFSCILDKYVNYINNHYGPNTTIVFDGYPQDAAEKSIKSAERIRRTRNMPSASVVFDETMMVTMPKECFLSNDQNKMRLITMLTDKFKAKNFQVKQAVEDADPMIVSTAIDLAKLGGTVIIVGEDIDLLVLLTAQEQQTAFCNIFLLKPGKGSQDNLMYSPSHCKLSDIAKKNILLLHAFSGCDSTSAFFRKGKKTFVKTFEKNSSLQRTAAVFIDPNATPNQIADAGAKFIVTLYTEGSTKSLNETRFDLFQRTLSKNDFNLACLPPTDAAARQHSLRVYFQVQVWKNNVLNPQQWGWKTTKHGLLPNPTDQPAAPQELLNKISCTCGKGCRATCSCRKAGIKCSIICRQCKGHTCTNSPPEDECLQNDITSYEVDVDVDEEFDTDAEMLQLEEFDENTPGLSFAKRRRL